MQRMEEIEKLSFETNPYLREIETPFGKTHFLNIRSILGVADEHGFGILAANCFLKEMVRGVAKAVFELNSPVIIQLAESQWDYALDPHLDGQTKLNQYVDSVVATISDLTKEHGYIVPIALHLDHLQKKDDLAFMACEAGFTSVELDFSHQPTEDRGEAVEMNIKRCAPIIPELHKYGVSVEVEEGEIGEASARGKQTEEEIMDEITKVEDAARLVEATNPEALAIFVGTAHGHYIRTPVVNFQRIAEIREALKGKEIDVPIVLHGGTGLTYDHFHQAIENGARKFNYATQLWTIAEEVLEQTQAGKALIEEMTKFEKEKAEEAGKKSRGPRYVTAQFLDDLYKLDAEVWHWVEYRVYDHAKDLLANAFFSAKKAELYPPASVY